MLPACQHGKGEYLKLVLNLAQQLVALSLPPRAVGCIDRVERDYLSKPTFRPEVIRSKSSAAAGLCAWVSNICKYFRIYQVGGWRFGVVGVLAHWLEYVIFKCIGFACRVGWPPINNKAPPCWLA